MPATRCPLNTEPALVIFGIVFIIACLYAVLVPYLRGRTDLVNCHNLFIAGSANFIGCSAINSGLTPHESDGSLNMDVVRLIAGTIVFYVVFAVTYRSWKRPARAAARRWLNWGPTTTTPLVMTVILCGGLGLLAIYPPNIPGLASLIVYCCTNAPLIGFTLAFVTWYRDRWNPVLLAVLCLAFGLYLVVSLSTGTGRQPLLALFLSVPIALYWLNYRYRRAGSTLFIVGMGGIVAFLVLSAYSEIRHKPSNPGDSMLNVALDRIAMLPSAIWHLEGVDRLFDPFTTDCSLAAIRHYSSWSDVRPFYTIWWIVANPIPRAVWQEKPESLGTMLPRELGVWKYGYVNWGPGIVGHGYHEGGLIMLVFYGVLFGGCVRFLDGVLVRQPDNPYMLGIFCAIATQLIAFSRGDIALYSVLIIGGIATGLSINWLNKRLFGVALVYPPGDDYDVHGGYGDGRDAMAYAERGPRYFG